MPAVRYPLRHPCQPWLWECLCPGRPAGPAASPRTSAAFCPTRKCRRPPCKPPHSPPAPQLPKLGWTYLPAGRRHLHGHCNSSHQGRLTYRKQEEIVTEKRCETGFYRRVAHAVVIGRGYGSGERPRNVSYATFFAFSYFPVQFRSFTVVPEPIEETT